MWENIWKGMLAASPLDWTWHILGVIFACYFTVPGLWWPHVEKYMKKRRERELARQQAQLQEQPPSHTSVPDSK